jgi:hypothetical protein
MQINFVKAVQHHFEFLLSDFGFTLLSASESPRGERWEGNVRYISDTTYLELNCSRGENPSLWIGRIKEKDGEKHLLPIQIIYEYMTLTDDEKTTILSNPDARQAAGILANKQLIRQVPNIENIDDRKTIQIELFAKSLRQYGLPFLRGDFSQWLGIWEYHVRKLTIENTRAGRPASVPVVITDDKGQLKVIGKESPFKKSLDYINELKEEQSPKPNI